MRDSLTISTPIENLEQTTEAPIIVEQQHHRIRMPYQVLRMLPRNATPEQQDSAIQAVFQPAEIRYSQQPDTLSLPGKDAGKKISDVSLPRYYTETYFKGSDFFKEEVNGGRTGVAGTPKPYNPVNDDLVVSVLLAMVLISIMTLSYSKHFITTHMGHFFSRFNPESSIMQETKGEIYSQLLFAVQTGTLLAITAYFFSLQNVADVYMVSNLQLLGIFLLAMVIYYLLLQLIYVWVEWTFFDRKRNFAAIQSRLIIMDIEGLLLLPVVAMHCFFGLNINTFISLVLGIVVFCKILSFLKEYVLMGTQRGALLFTATYSLALDFIPFALLVGTVVALGELLKVTY